MSELVVGDQEERGIYENSQDFSWSNLTAYDVLKLGMWVKENILGETSICEISFRHVITQMDSDMRVKVSWHSRMRGRRPESTLRWEIQLHHLLCDLGQTTGLLSSLFLPLEMWRQSSPSHRATEGDCESNNARNVLWKGPGMQDMLNESLFLWLLLRPRKQSVEKRTEASSQRTGRFTVQCRGNWSGDRRGRQTGSRRPRQTAAPKSKDKKSATCDDTLKRRVSHPVVFDSCDPMDCSLPGSSVHGILWARILEWTAISFSRGSSQPRDQTPVSCTAGGFFTVWATREADGAALLSKRADTVETACVQLNWK